MTKRDFRVGSNFSKLVARKSDGDFECYFIDKTLFIKQFIEKKSEVLLIPRPRRFGKSTNLDMLRSFFSIDEEKENKKLFMGLAIDKETLADGTACMEYQGKYPVVHLTFKDLQQGDMRDPKDMLKSIIADVYRDFHYLTRSPNLFKTDVVQIEKFIGKNASDAEYQEALFMLSSYLHSHHKCRVIVLIDEYDVPFQKAMHTRDYAQTDADRNKGEKFLKDLADFFAVFLGRALKENKHLEKALMTGVVHIAGAGVFSGLNNMDVWTIFDDEFSDSFGFTETELNSLLMQVDEAAPAEKYKQWYNGYKFGSTIIYNPWSVMKALARKHDFSAHWLETSNNDLIYSMFLHPRNEQEAQEINAVIADLLSKKEVKKTLQSKLIFDSRTKSIEHLWILLLSAGYLKAEKIENLPDSTSLICTLAIPNMEVESIYKIVFLDWAQQNVQLHASSPLVEYLLTGDAKSFCTELRGIFQNTVSFRDTQNSKDENQTSRYEAFYHGFMVALLALSLDKKQHTVLLTSNRESGYGYYDLVLEPRKINDTVYYKGVIFEFKRSLSAGDLKTDAQAALQQIKDKEYMTNMKVRGVREVVCIGMAFYQKQLEEKYETYNCWENTHSNSAVPSVTDLQQETMKKPMATTSSDAEPIDKSNHRLAIIAPQSSAQINHKSKNDDIDVENLIMQPVKKPKTDHGSDDDFQSNPKQPSKNPAQKSNPPG